MLTEKLPVSIDLLRAAQSGLTYKGVVPAKQLKRLNELCASDCSDVHVSIECGVDLQRIVYLKGKAVAELTLECQRCMRPFITEVTINICLSPCRTQTEIDELPQTYDPIECNELGHIHLHQMIEDELLLAMPVIPVHEDATCHLGTQDMVVGEVDITQIERPNPFAVLQKLKSK